jgi:hypothetical protein
LGGCHSRKSKQGDAERDGDEESTRGAHVKLSAPGKRTIFARALQPIYADSGEPRRQIVMGSHRRRTPLC